MLKIILAIIIFTLIVLFHELGHFLLAKWNGVCVEEFAVGIGPTLIGKKIGETVYGIKAFPFGGCCVMKGEDDEDEGEGSLNSKTALQRFSIIAAGPVFNFILAFLLGMLLIGLSGAKLPVIEEVAKDSGAYKAGLQAGDEIVRLDSSRIHIFGEITIYNFFHDESADVRVTYKRDGKLYQTTVTRVRSEEYGMYMMGITGGRSVRQDLLGIIRYGYYEMRYQIIMVVQSLKYMASGHLSLNDISGPVGIVNTIGNSYEASIVYGVRAAFLTMLSFSIMLSANLGVMNLLPLPALDGGRLVFIVIEMIRGKKIPPEKEGMVHLAGLVLLLALMLVVMGNDLRKIFFV